MKTKQYISTALIAMVFTSASIHAQSTRRPASQERKESTAEARTQTREVKKQKAYSAQPARQTQKQQVQRQRSTQPARQVKTQQAQRQRSTQPARQIKTQQAQRQRSTQPARQAQTQQVQRQRSTQPARQAQTQQAQRQRSTQPAQQAQRQRTVQNSRQHANVTTSNNPRSTYRKPDSKVYVKHNRTANNHRNKFSTERYYGGNHYHYAYPTKKVKFHYHHDTYLHNYHVLYYPAYTNIYWTRHMYRDYRRWYPEYNWNYNYGYRIQTISVFDAKFNLGEVANVYGRVYSTWHNEETNDYLLFFGGDFPYQQFTVVLPARIARKFSWRPERYFLGEHITITGLITTFDGNPEIVVKDKHQIGIY